MGRERWQNGAPRQERWPAGALPRPARAVDALERRLDPGAPALPARLAGRGGQSGPDQPGSRGARPRADRLRAARTREEPILVCRAGKGKRKVLLDLTLVCFYSDADDSIAR
jgi:hypothetical protein